MRNIAASIIALTLIATGAIRKAKKELQSSGELLVLCFHNPGRQYFAKAVKWLKKNGFTIITAEEVVDYYVNGKSLPYLPVWLTLDDGWRGNYENVHPVLKNENVQASIFAVTCSVEQTGVFWWTFAEEYKHMLPEKFQNDFGLLWKVAERERKNVINELYLKVKDRLNREALTVNELKEISSTVFFGSHTVNHVIMPNCTDEELITELQNSKIKIEEWTGKKVNVFAFPNADHSEREEKFLIETGYDIAVIGGNCFAGKNDNRYRIPRMSMGEAYFPEELCHMFGVWQKFIKRIKRK